MRTVSFNIEYKPLRNPYTYARSTVSEQEIVVLEIAQDGKIGRGECSPYSSFFGNPSDATFDAIRSMQLALENGANRHMVMQAMPPGPARCAIDCALWDLEAALAGQPVWTIANRAAPRSVQIAHTISLDDLDTVHLEARKARHLPILKIKGGAANDAERVRIVRQEAPDARLTIDPNGGWNIAQLESMLPVLVDCGIEMLEQPLARGHDNSLISLDSPIPIFADESFADMNDFDYVLARYDGINIKLDKCGGLTPAYQIVDRAREEGLRVMVGCLAGTSLSAAPGMLIATMADFVDLDSQLWHLNDREPVLPYSNGTLSPGTMADWGTGRKVHTTVSF